MAHDLEIDEKGVRFAHKNVNPWHRLGVIMDAERTPAEMLAAARADFDVQMRQVIVTDEHGLPLQNADGTYVYVDNSRATVRLDKDGTASGLATLGTRYVPMQNAEVLERALAVVAATDGDANVETVGVTDNGRRFFAGVNLGNLVIDPLGVNDKIAMYLLVYSSHDGKVPITFANTPVRPVCQNTVVMGLSAARSTFKARHTANSAEVIDNDARTALGFSLDWADAFKAEAERLLAIPMTDGRFDKVLDIVVPISDDATDRQKANRDDIVASMKGLYKGATNALIVGETGWAAVQAIGEFYDHYRDGTPDDRALTSMDLGSWVSKQKIKAHQAVLSLV